MEELKEKIDIASEKIEEASDLFYQHKDHEGYLRLDQVIGTLMELAEGLKQAVSENPELELNAEDFLATLNEAVDALEERDTVLLSDILQYDLIEQLDILKERIDG